MTVIKRSEIVPYTAAQMYELITAIEKYPEFLPWCKEANVQNKTQYKVKAEFQGYKAGINFYATVLYNLQHPNKMIEIRLLDGRVFRTFEGFWRFETLESKKTRFSFELKFEFSNAILGWTITPFIKSGSTELLENFCERAKILYG